MRKGRRRTSTHAAKRKGKGRDQPRADGRVSTPLGGASDSGSHVLHALFPYESCIVKDFFDFCRFWLALLYSCSFPLIGAAFLGGTMWLVYAFLVWSSPSSVRSFIYILFWKECGVRHFVVVTAFCSILPLRNPPPNCPKVKMYLKWEVACNLAWGWCYTNIFSLLWVDCHKKVIIVLLWMLLLKGIW